MNLRLRFHTTGPWKKLLVLASAVIVSEILTDLYFLQFWSGGFVAEKINGNLREDIYLVQ